MPASVKWSGLEELKTHLRNLPSELTQEASPIVDHAAEVTKASLIQSYPVGDTGKLRQGVSVKLDEGASGVRATVISKSPHAHLWEFGTQVRATRQGWNRGKGPSHYNQGLIGIAMGWRRRMHQQLIDVVRKAGFDVKGTL